MRRFIILAIFVFCILAMMIFAWAKQSGGSDGVAYYQKIAPWTTEEMMWHSATRTLLSDGIILYQPTFPKSPLRVKVDRLTLQTKQNAIVLRFSNGVLDAAQTLLDRGPAKLTDGLRDFQKPVDFLLRPIEALVLLNQDILKGSLEVTVKPQGQQTQVLVRLWQKGQDVLQVRGMVQNVPNRHLWGWVNGTIQTVQVSVSDADLLKAVAGYFVATRQIVPAELAQAIQQQKSFQTTVRLSEPFRVSDLF